MIIAGDKALRIARQQLGKIEIYQGVECAYDIPSEIELGAFDLSMDPVLYYSVKHHRDRINNFYFVLFCAYHYRDYSRCVGAKLTASFLKGEHRHDFEGFVLRVPYYNPRGFPRSPRDIITVAHKRLEYNWDEGMGDGFIVTIDSRGHAIHSCTHMDENHKGLHNPMLLNKVKLLPYSGIKNIEKIRAEFNANGVNLPDQWSDNGEYKGWMLNRPHDLFNAMENE